MDIKKERLDGVKEMISDHWGYIEKMLIAHDEAPDTIEKVGFHYKTSGIHFYKHALEDEDKRLVSCSCIKPSEDIEAVSTWVAFTDAKKEKQFTKSLIQILTNAKNEGRHLCDELGNELCKGVTCSRCPFYEEAMLDKIEE